VVILIEIASLAFYWVYLHEKMGGKFVLLIERQNLMITVKYFL